MQTTEFNILLFEGVKPATVQGVLTLSVRNLYFCGHFQLKI